MNTHLSNQVTKVHRILVVAEGDLNFEDGDDYSLSYMLDQLKGWECIDQATGAIHVFETIRVLFDPETSLVALIKAWKCDQLWLFGSSETIQGEEFKGLLNKDELLGLDELMRNDGLGVFSTGDHAETGAALCSEIPRVRRLRRWRVVEDGTNSAPSRDFPDRVETLVPALFPVAKGLPEGDSMPKTVWSRNHRDGNVTSLLPHELFFHPDFERLSFLPDHMHEGICVEPVFQQQSCEQCELFVEEFPIDSTSEIVAWTVCVSIPNGLLPPSPAIHPVVSCFDHKSFGRVVTDSTFHHWVWGNLLNIVDSPSLAWKHIRQYPRNIAAWLARVSEIKSPQRAIVSRLSGRVPVLSALSASKALPSIENMERLGKVIRLTASDMEMDVDRIKLVLTNNVEREKNVEMEPYDFAGYPGEKSEDHRIGRAFVKISELSER